MSCVHTTVQKATHLAFGVMIGGLLFALGLPISVAFLTGFSAFIPDLDFLIDKVWLSPTGAIKQAWRKTTGLHGMHRRIFHNIWTALLWAFLVGVISKWSLLAMSLAFFGVISHLLLDSLTYTGVYWMWPYGQVFGKKNFWYWKGPISTGRPEEARVRTGIFIMGSIFFGIGLFRQAHINFSEQSIFITFFTLGILACVGYRLMNSFVRASSRATRVFSNRKRQTSRGKRRNRIRRLQF